jgi:sirohydrochlorin cobaltochelatase
LLCCYRCFAYKQGRSPHSYNRRMTGLILFAHGARDPRWAEPFERLKRKVETARPGVPVALAYLEIMQPDLAGAADQLIAVGCRSLRIVPVFLGQGGHVREDLPAIVATLAARHPAVAITLVTAVGEHDAVLDRIVDIAVEGLPG